MNAQLGTIIISALLILLLMIIIYVIWFIFWTAIRVPIKMRDDIFRDREEATKDLEKIRAENMEQWSKFREMTDEIERLRNAYYAEKSKLEKITEEKIKLETDKDNLIRTTKELKKSIKTEAK